MSVVSLCASLHLCLQLPFSMHLGHLGYQTKNINHEEKHYFRKFAISQKAKKETLRVFACFVYLMCICVCVCLSMRVCVWVYVKLCAWLLVGALRPLGKGGTGLAPLGPIAYDACHLLFLRFCACLLCLSVHLTFSIHLGAKLAI